eukprot:6194745-Pleurochrysis_carterae.AAC.2
MKPLPPTSPSHASPARTPATVDCSHDATEAKTRRVKAREAEAGGKSSCVPKSGFTPFAEALEGLIVGCSMALAVKE